MAAGTPRDRADGAEHGAEMDSNYQVPDCGCAEPWYFHSVRLLGARGIGAAKEAAQKYGRENAPLLLPGTHTTSYTIKRGNSLDYKKRWT